MVDKKKSPQTESTGPRRSPGADRQRDADRSRRLLLDAALDEFAAKGFAGARTQDIADRAGVNKQLIAYYFGGKEGLYRALEEQWLEQERGFVKPGMTIDELTDAYMRNLDPRMARLLIWEGLRPTRAAGEDSAVGEDEGVAELRERQRAGEIAADIDPRHLMLAMMGVALAPIAMPQVARRMGLDPESLKFMREYTAFLRQLAGRLK